MIMTHKTPNGDDCVFQDHHTEHKCWNSYELFGRFALVFCVLFTVGSIVAIITRIIYLS